MQLRTKTSLADAVAKIPGAVLVATGSIEQNGQSFVTGRIEVANGWEAADLLLTLSKEDASDPRIRQVALDFRARFVSDAAVARQIFDFVKRTVTFVREPVETFQSADYTLFHAQYGDCDDMARAVYALARAAGLRARLAFLSKKGQPAHVWAQLFHDGVWHHAETTVDAEYGEDPRSAAARVGTGRPDLFSDKVVTMEGVLGADKLTLTPGMRLRMAIEREGFVHTDQDSLDWLSDLGFEQITVYSDPNELPPDWPAYQKAMQTSGTGPGAGMVIWADASWNEPATSYARTTPDYSIRGADLVNPEAPPAPPKVPVILTKDLSDGFFSKLLAVGARRNIDPAFLLAIMNFESGLKASAKNPSGAYGISQIMDLPSVGFHGTPAEYLSLSAEDQLPYVDAYFSHHAGEHLNTIERLYQANFLPATLSWGSDPSLVLVRQGGGSQKWPAAWHLSEAAVYDANAGLDHGKKGYITVEDLGIAVRKAMGTRFQEALARLKAACPYEPAAPSDSGGLVALLGMAVFAGVALSHLD